VGNLQATDRTKKNRRREVGGEIATGPPRIVRAMATNPLKVDTARGGVGGTGKKRVSGQAFRLGNSAISCVLKKKQGTNAWGKESGKGEEDQKSREGK